jgi:hypothetical protein
MSNHGSKLVCSLGKASGLVRQHSLSALAKPLQGYINSILRSQTLYCIFCLRIEPNVLLHLTFSPTILHLLVLNTSTASYLISALSLATTPSFQSLGDIPQLSHATRHVDSLPSCSSGLGYLDELFVVAKTLRF